METKNFFKAWESNGYPKPGQNIRTKPLCIYDTKTIATGTTQYNFFQSDAAGLFDVNRKMPTAGTEIFLIDGVRLLIENPLFVLSANTSELFSHAYLQIIVNNREYLKVPLWEILFMYMADTIGTGTTSPINYKQYARKRTLQFPIIINSTDQTSFQIQMSANAATGFNNAIFRLELTGSRYDKLSDFLVDYRGNDQLERISYSFFESQNVVVTANQYNLFSGVVTNPLRYNQTLAPMPNSQSFALEAVEILFSSQNSGYSLSDIIGYIYNCYLTIQVDQIEYMLFGNSDMYTFFKYGSVTFGDSGGALTTGLILNEYFKGTYVLPQGKQILFPANCRAQIFLNQPAGAGLQNSMCVSFRGTLERLV